MPVFRVQSDIKARTLNDDFQGKNTSPTGKIGATHSFYHTHLDFFAPYEKSKQLHSFITPNKKYLRNIFNFISVSSKS